MISSIKMSLPAPWFNFFIKYWLAIMPRRAELTTIPFCLTFPHSRQLTSCYKLLLDQITSVHMSWYPPINSHVLTLTNTFPYLKHIFVTNIKKGHTILIKLNNGNQLIIRNSTRCNFVEYPLRQIFLELFLFSCVNSHLIISRSVNMFGK